MTVTEGGGMTANWRTSHSGTEKLSASKESASNHEDVELTECSPGLHMSGGRVASNALKSAILSADITAAKRGPYNMVGEIDG